MIEKIGKITIDDTHYPGQDFYCDGTIEDEILEIVRENAAVKADYSDRRNVSEANKALLREFKVEGFPTLIVLDSKGKEKGRIVGYRPEKVFFAELEKLLK